MIPAPSLEKIGARVSANARLSNFTTFRLGGPCPLFVDCTSRAVFAAAWPLLADQYPVLLGGGSNLLVSDDGLQQPVIRYVSIEPEILFKGDDVVVSAGTSLDDLARLSAERGRDGMVMCSGIPGTVGGAVAGNAGAFGEQIGDRVIMIETIDRCGKIRERHPEDLHFAYRRSSIAALDEIILSVRLRLSIGDREKLLARRQEILDLRASKHPDWRNIPTAGSFFKNIEPTSKAERRQAAGWFLEQAGALAMRVGGARTFERHANIIIAEPGCTARDVLRLSEMMAGAVDEKFGFKLEREVKLLGAF
jgi:UDP-N-acetylmuramate dehydrogenase